MEKNILYEGIPVNYYFFPGEDEFIYYGTFKLTNISSETVEVVFNKAELLTDNFSEELKTFAVNIDGDLIDKKTNIDGNSFIQIKITFPFISVQDLKFNTLKIRSEITVHLEKFFADSDAMIFFETEKKS